MFLCSIVQQLTQHLPAFASTSLLSRPPGPTSCHVPSAQLSTCWPSASTSWCSRRHCRTWWQQGHSSSSYAVPAAVPAVQAAGCPSCCRQQAGAFVRCWGNGELGTAGWAARLMPATLPAAAALAAVGQAALAAVCAGSCGGQSRALGAAVSSGSRRVTLVVTLVVSRAASSRFSCVLSCMRTLQAACSCRPLSTHSSRTNSST